MTWDIYFYLLYVPSYFSDSLQFCFMMNVAHSSECKPFILILSCISCVELMINGMFAKMYTM